MAGAHGILSVWNLDAEGNAVTSEICADQIDGLPEGEYAVYEHFSQSLRMLAPGERFSVTLDDPDDYRLYLFAPVTDGFAVIGRTDKYISPKTVRSFQNGCPELTEPGPCAWVEHGVLKRA